MPSTTWGFLLPGVLWVDVAVAAALAGAGFGLLGLRGSAGRTCRLLVGLCAVGVVLGISASAAYWIGGVVPGSARFSLGWAICTATKFTVGLWLLATCVIVFVTSSATAPVAPGANRDSGCDGPSVTALMAGWALIVHGALWALDRAPLGLATLRGSQGDGSAWGVLHDVAVPSTVVLAGLVVAVCWPGRRRLLPSALVVGGLGALSQPLRFVPSAVLGVSQGYSTLSNTITGFAHGSYLLAAAAAVGLLSFWGLLDTRRAARSSGCDGSRVGVCSEAVPRGS